MRLLVQIYRVIKSVIDIPSVKISDEVFNLSRNLQTIINIFLLTHKSHPVVILLFLLLQQMRIL